VGAVTSKDLEFFPDKRQRGEKKKSQAPSGTEEKTTRRPPFQGDRHAFSSISAGKKLLNREGAGLRQKALTRSSARPGKVFPERGRRGEQASGGGVQTLTSLEGEVERKKYSIEGKKGVPYSLNKRKIAPHKRQPPRNTM